MNTTTEAKMTTTQTDFAFAQGSIFAVQPGCTVEFFKGKKGIVVAIFEANIDGRIPLLVNLETGMDAMPFVDEVKVTRPAVRRGFNHEMSQETAERFADWNRRGNGR